MLRFRFGFFSFTGITVRLFRHDRYLLKVIARRRRSGLPLQASGVPRIRGRPGAILERPKEIQQGQQVSDAENGGPGGGENMEDLKLGRIRMITPRLAQIAEKK